MVNESIEQADEVDEADLNMVCTDINEVDPNGLSANIHAVDEITVVELKQEVEELSSTSLVNMTSSALNQPAAEQSAGDLQHDGAEVQGCEVSGTRKQPVKRPFACNVCGNLYARPKMLEKHRRKHEGEQDVGPLSKSIVSQSEMNSASNEGPSQSAGKNHRRTKREQYGMYGADNKGFVCGECGDNFIKASEAKSHMFTKHMCLSSEQRQDGEVKVVRILKSDMTQLPTTTENSVNLPTPREVADSRNIEEADSKECGRNFTTAVRLRAHRHTHSDERQYQCDQCGKWFRRSSGRNEHIRNVHDGVKAYQCTHCRRAFSTSGALKLHVMGHTGERPHACSMCPKRFKRAINLELHMTTHLPTPREVADSGNIEEVDSKPVVENPTSVPDTSNVISGSLGLEDNGRSRDVENVEVWPVANRVDVVDSTQSKSQELCLCSFCGKVFSTLRALRIHMQLHQRPDYECEDCGRKFARSDYLTAHRRVHSNERPFLCMECGHSFTTASTLRSHLHTHSDERQYQCYQCGKWFRRSSGRNEHIRNVHEGVKAYQCTHCPRAFSTSGALKLHLMGHTGERPHACTMCPKRFKRATKLELHLATHSGDRPFPCAVCGQRFTQKSSLRMHEVTQHTADGGRCHECELCGQRFSKRSIRDAHVRRHRGEKPHTCTICYRSFAFIGDLCNHMIKKHKVRRSADRDSPNGQPVTPMCADKKANRRGSSYRRTRRSPPH